MYVLMTNSLLNTLKRNCDFLKPFKEEDKIV